MSDHDRSSVTLTISADYAELPLLRHVIRQTLPPLSDDQESRYLSAVTEIAVNAIDASTATGVIEVCLVLSPVPAVLISDSGSGFDPEAPVTSKVDSLGQGVAIASTMVPEMKIESSPTGTTVTLPYPTADQTAS